MVCKSLPTCVKNCNTDQITIMEGYVKVIKSLYILGFHMKTLLKRPNCLEVHPNLYNINPHNVTHSLISWNPRNRMIVVQISLLIVTFPSLTQTTKEINHTLALRHVSTCGVSPSYSNSYSSSYATCWMLVHAYATSLGKAKWSGPHHTIKMLHFVLIS